MADEHAVALRLDVESDSEILLADRKFTTLAEVAQVVTEFITRCGEPDEGPQTITIVVKSNRK